jgi:hypothetical protein
MTTKEEHIDIVEIVKHPRVLAGTTCSCMIPKFFVDQHRNNSSDFSMVSTCVGLNHHDTSVLASGVQQEK